MTTQTLTRIHVPSIRFRFGQFLPLASILGLQTILALSLNNTVFQDEALYLYAGRQYLTALLGGPPVIEPYGQYIAGLSYFLPLDCRDSGCARRRTTGAHVLALSVFWALQLPSTSLPGHSLTNTPPL